LETRESSLAHAKRAACACTCACVQRGPLCVGARTRRLRGAFFAGEGTRIIRSQRGKGKALARNRKQGATDTFPSSRSRARACPLARSSCFSASGGSLSLDVVRGKGCAAEHPGPDRFRAESAAANGAPAAPPRCVPPSRAAGLRGPRAYARLSTSAGARTLSWRALRSAGRLSGRRRRYRAVLGCEARPLGAYCVLRARSPVASPTPHPLFLAATTIPRHVGRHHPAKYACALACARTNCPLALEPVLPHKVPAVDLRQSASLQLARAAESAALPRCAME
jgi:hypothetical protein